MYRYVEIKDNKIMIWNEVIEILNITTDVKVKAYGEMILRQYNTAGAKKSMERTLKQFITDNKI